MTLREIDALVAENVFGWDRMEGDAIVEVERASRALESRYDPADGKRWHNRRAWYSMSSGKAERMACEECGSLPQFTTDPAASKQVREKLAERYTEIVLHRSGKLVECIADNSLTDLLSPRAIRGVADTEELAVAICSLRACGVEVDAPAVSAGGE